MPARHDPRHADFYREVGARLAAARIACGMTQAALGQLTHIGRTSLANIERGWQHPPLHVLCALAAVLRIPLESLIAATPTVTRIDGPWHMHGHSWDHTS